MTRDDGSHQFATFLPVSQSHTAKIRHSVCTRRSLTASEGRPLRWVVVAMADGSHWPQIAIVYSTLMFVANSDARPGDFQYDVALSSRVSRECT